MKTHEQLIQLANKAIEDLFSDASVSPETTKDDLEALVEDIEMRIETIESDITFLNPCEGCGNQGSTGMFGHRPPGDGLNLCRDACDIGRERE